MTWMVIRVRGGIHAQRRIVETLDRLHLTRPNHATLLPEAPSYRGMITKVQGYVTWGEAEPETVALLLKERGRRDGGGPLSAPSNGAGALDLPKLAESVSANGLLGVDGVKPLLRLHPPTGGWRSTKKTFQAGGSLGYRGRAINDLAKRMV